MKNSIPSDDSIEFKTTVLRHKHTKSATAYYVSAIQRLQLCKLGDVPYLIFSYYLEKALTDGYDYDDGRVAAAFGYSKQKVKRARLILIKNGWFIQSTYKNKNGLKVRMTYLGQAAVNAYHQNKHTIDITKLDPTIYE
jgi:hypothetical protein